MDSFKFHDVKVEKANAISKHRSIKKLTTLFRILELFVFIIILSRFTTQLSFPFDREHFRGLSVTLISPRFVFLAGNAIVVVLFLISGQLSSEKSVDFYDEYVDKCINNINSQQKRFGKEERKASCEQHGVVEVRKRKVVSMRRCESERSMERGARGRELRRSVSERGRRKREEEMSGEEFRRKVEAFIARQQRVLREEEEEGCNISAVVKL